MRSPVSFIVAASGSFALLATGHLVAQDWPQWCGPGRDAKVTGFKPPVTWPNQLNLKWRVKVGQGEASPALVGDRLYVLARQGDEEVLLCLNPADGTEKWAYRYSAQPVTGPANPFPGPRSSPAVADGKIVCLGVGGVLSCLNAQTGKEIWRKHDPKEVPLFFTAMSPLIVDRMCIVHLGGENKGVVAALDLASGEPKWKWSGEGPSYSSPVLITAGGTKQVVVQTEKRLIGLGLADGRLLWDVGTERKDGYWHSATPVVDDQTVFYTGQGTGTRAARIERQRDGFAVRQLWCNEKLGTCYNTPVLKDGLLFGVSDRGHLFCMDSRTGAANWTLEARCSPFATIVDAGPVLLTLPTKPVLVVYKPDGKEYTEIARYTVADAETYAFPIISGNRVFVRDRISIALWMLE
ncbi:MAG: PQQ-binding-like beta-propeller repeat protein [Phycisphaerae bacterium]|nr:PQQ-binding-like beta-propeller repeat protein [Phycisphaerae bacterium]